MAQNKPSKIRSVITLLILILWIITMVSWFFIATIIRYKYRTQIPQHFHVGCCMILGLKITITGALCQTKPVLYVANHISYLDIFMMGANIPAYFIAKSEVARWPILGWLARLQNTLFFERNSSYASTQIDIMQQHLRDNKNLLFYPEGTSTAGLHVQPFKSSLFRAAELDDVNIDIQPMTISYTRYDDKTLSHSDRDYFAWYADMPFAPHFFNVMGLKPVTVELMLHKPVKISDFASRKECAKYCQRQIEGALYSSLNQTMRHTKTMRHTNVYIRNE